MNGQWVGKYTGDNNGRITVNMDDRGDNFEGVIYLIESNQALPSTSAIFRTTNKEETFNIRIPYLEPLNPNTGLPDTWTNVKKLYAPNTIFPEHADVKGRWNNEKFVLEWETSTGTSGVAHLQKSKAGEPSEYPPLRTNWEGFKKHVSMLEGRKYLFRGQNEPWRLRTAFHRTGRADLTRFTSIDIPALHRHLSARTKHQFNLDNSNENGAFFNLIQHHGYPTPLLDWTYSPYVAAFFAFRNITKRQEETATDNDVVRIFVFDHKQWESDFNQVHHLLIAGPHLSTSELIAIENERMIPQQAMSTLTNIDDIESYIMSRETEDKVYLRVIDIPVKERTAVNNELSSMGITAGALFPGLDGACEELKERFFKI